jgi:DNA-nicking Smr family endonuclease
MPPRARRLSEADQAIWTNYAQQLSPLRRPTTRRPPKPDPPKPAASEPPPATTALQLRSKVTAQPSRPRTITSPLSVGPLSVGTQPGGIDKSTWRRFQSGKLVAERTLDLHGMTAQRAFHALVSFLRTAHAQQVRCVEVVTGRGTGETGGVIRREFSHWLNLPEIRPLILGAAHPHALNPGSVRLILRRIR